jgi:AmiR/NasT family two-component response regulator
MQPMLDGGQRNEQDALRLLRTAAMPANLRLADMARSLV